MARAPQTDRSSGQLSRLAAAAVACADRLSGLLSSLCLAGFTLIVCYTVISRGLFGTVPRWSEELPRVLLIWCVFLGVSVGIARDSHLRSDLLSLITRRPWVLFLGTLIGKLLTLAYFIVVAITSFWLVGATRSHSLPALGISPAVAYLALVLGAGAAALTLVLRFVRRQQ